MINSFIQLIRLFIYLFILFLGQLINNKDLSTKEVKVSCVDYITAGVDTVGNSLIYAIWLISSSDSVQKRLREELESIGK